MMKTRLLTFFLVPILAQSVSATEIAFGGTDTTNVDNWTTNSVLFNQGTTDGYSLDWENVVVNTATVDSPNNEFDIAWETGTNYTIGHLFMYSGTADLATLAADGGIQVFHWTADFEATAYQNWSPVISVTDGGVTTFYRWNHSNNTWNGNEALDFALNGQFDLSQLGNATNPSTGIWGELKQLPDGTIGNWGATRTNTPNPNLQATTGVVQFGFIQWGASSGGDVPNGTTFSTAIDSFEILINPDNITAPVVTSTAGTATSATSATMPGEVTDNGKENPNVTIYFGTTDGGEVAGDWDLMVDIGIQPSAFTPEIAGLDPDTTYIFRAFAENSAGGAWAASSAQVTTPPLTGITTVLASGSFDYQYEMDVNPSTQDLDAAGSANDWWPGPSGSLVDGTPQIPQTYAAGIGSSDQNAADNPAVLFRTDYTGSIQRQTVADSFTVEFSVQVEELSVSLGDVGAFGVFLQPIGAGAALQVNISENNVSLGADGATEIATGSNSDAQHVFRIAYSAIDQRYWIWRDGVLIAGGQLEPGGGIEAAEANVWGTTGGGWLLGDFAANISGEWHIDYLRIHNEATAPEATGPLAITDIQLVDGNVVLTWNSVPGREYVASRSHNGKDWEEFNDELIGAPGVGSTTEAVEPIPADPTTLYRVSEL